MPDSRFFKRSSPLSLKELADITGAQLAESADPACLIEDVAPLDKADTKTLSFLDNVKYKEQFSQTKAGACIVSEEMISLAPANTNILCSPSPYKAYALAAKALYPDDKPESCISDAAHINAGAKIGNGCRIEDGAVVKNGAKIGDNTWIESNAVIGENTEIGSGCRIGANAVVTHSIIGDNVRIYPGCCIGQDGFGFAIDPAGHVKVPQLGRVIIGDSVEIGANTTIDRGSGPDTEIGTGTWIDNLVQVAHNVKIGKHCIIISQVGISGSTTIEDYAVLAGQVGVAGHLRIGQGAQVGAQSGVMRDVPAGQQYLGAPAVPVKQFMRQVAALNKLIQNKKS